MAKDWAEEALARFELTFHPQRKELRELVEDGVAWRRIASLYPFEPAVYPGTIQRSLRRTSSWKLRSLLQNFDRYAQNLDQDLRDLTGDKDSGGMRDPYFFGSPVDTYDLYLFPTHWKALGVTGRRVLDRSETCDYTSMVFSLYALPRTLHNMMRLGGVDALPSSFQPELPALRVATEATIRHLRLK